LCTVLESTADAAYVIDETGFFHSWNRAAEELFGYASSEVVNQACWELVRGRGAMQAPICTDSCQVIKCAVANRDVPNFDMQIRHRSGEWAWVNVSVVRFRDQRSDRLYVIHLLRSIEHRKQAEQLTLQVLAATKQLHQLDGRPIASEPISPLTGQERKILRLLAEGKRPSDVESELRISQRTVRNHMHHVNQKLRTSNRLEAVLHAVRAGLI
jgi:PAS domain S-box-containing protein